MNNNMKLKCMKKKNISPLEIYTIIYLANDKQFIETLPRKQKEWLINDIKESNPDQCICCPCFAWEYGEDKKICGCTCTLGGISREDGKGQCNFT